MLRQEALPHPGLREDDEARRFTVTKPHPDPGPRPDVDEADLLEQQTTVDPPGDTDDEQTAGTVPSVAADADSADLADRLEQLEDVPSEDDDYPYEV